jgi:hypothetical protein
LEELFSIFLPGVYKETLIFRKTNKRIELDELKNVIIQGIKRFDSDDSKEIKEKWIREIKSSDNIKQILTGKKE